MEFRNLKIYQPDGTFRSGGLSISGDRITGTEVGSDAADMGGLYAIPGLVDLHFHGCMGYDFCDGTAEAISALASYQAQNGVAAICPATMTYPEEKLSEIAQAAAAWSAEPHEAALVGINMEGPFISEKKKGAQNAAYLHAPDAAMFRRDVTRLEDCKVRLDECPLGSGALAGTTYPIDRWETAKALGFAAPMGNSLDGVSDRDYALELLSALSILMMHLSRFAEEVILWCSWEFKFIELDDAYATGSSIMPQKKNPDVAELVRGKTGRVYGDLMSLLTVMKGLPLAYNKDMQEDKEPVFDAVDTVEMCLPVFAAMLDTMTVRTDNMRKAAGHGFINATDCADYLTKKGMPFRDAYTVTGKLVAQCTAQGKTLEELTLEELQAVSPLFEQDVYDALNLENCMALRSSYGGPAVSETARQIGEIEQFIQERS